MRRRVVLFFAMFVLLEVTTGCCRRGYIRSHRWSHHRAVEVGAPSCGCEVGSSPISALGAPVGVRSGMVSTPTGTIESMPGKIPSIRENNGPALNSGK